MIKTKKRKILLLPGDGVGPEVINEVKKIIQWMNSKKSLDFQTDEDLNEDYSNSELLDIYAPRDNVYLNSPIYLYKDEPTRGDTRYWGSYGSNSEIFGIELSLIHI